MNSAILKSLKIGKTIRRNQRYLNIRFTGNNLIPL